jgi:hypothetical protein
MLYVIIMRLSNLSTKKKILIFIEGKFYSIGKKNWMLFFFDIS